MIESAEQLELFTTASDPIAYAVRESPRAKHVSIKINLRGTVEVVVPVGFNSARIPDIIQRRQDWIRQNLQRIHQQQDQLSPEHFTERPAQLDLRACHQTWRVTYEAQPGLLKLSQSGAHTLQLRGPLETSNPSSDATSELLRQWLTRKARAVFAPWLRELSFELQLPFHHLSIRGQKTRWASCSSQQNISLNYKLLFLPLELVHYVFVHELCHTIHMNHSPAFWQLVGQKLPAYSQQRADLREGWRYVPQWVESSAR